jgi:hypothetical protein
LTRWSRGFFSYCQVLFCSGKNFLVQGENEWAVEHYRIKQILNDIFCSVIIWLVKYHHKRIVLRLNDHLQYLVFSNVLMILGLLH